MANKPKPGSRMSQTKVDSAERGRETKQKALRRSVKDKSTGAMVYPTKDLQAYTKADQAWAKARIDHLTPAQRAAKRARGKKKK